MTYLELLQRIKAGNPPKKIKVFNKDNFIWEDSMYIKELSEEEEEIAMWQLLIPLHLAWCTEEILINWEGLIEIIE